MNKLPVTAPDPTGWHHDDVTARPKEIGSGRRSGMSTEEKNKVIIRRFLEELTKGNLDVIDELLSPDFVDRSLMPEQDPTREGFKRSMVASSSPSLRSFSAATCATSVG